MERYFLDKNHHMSYRSFVTVLSVTIALITFLSTWSLVIARNVQANSNRSKDAVCSLIYYFDRETIANSKLAAAIKDEQVREAYFKRIESAQELINDLRHLRIHCE